MTAANILHQLYWTTFIFFYFVFVCVLSVYVAFFYVFFFFLSLHFVSNIISGVVLLIFYVFSHLYCDISASSVISLFTFFLLAICLFLWHLIQRTYHSERCLNSRLMHICVFMEFRVIGFPVRRLWTPWPSCLHYGYVMPLSQV